MTWPAARDGRRLPDIGHLDQRRRCGIVCCTATAPSPLAWLLLGQTIATMQVAGTLIVVGAVMWLGLSKR